MRKRLNLLGKTFGRLTIISKAPDIYKNGKVKTVWVCKCSCGTTKNIRTTYLTTNNFLSCGCIKKEKIRKALFKDITNQKFGKLTVLELYRVDNKRGSIWTCLCECGKFKNVLSGSLTSGNTKSCGCQVKLKKRLSK